MPRDLYVLPASPGQEWMWLIHHMSRDVSPYVIAGMVRIRGPVDLDALNRSLDLLVERHEALRTVFRMDLSGDLSQVIRQAEPVGMETSGLDGDGDGTLGTEDRIREIFRKFVERPFDLSQGPLLRAAVTRIGTEDHVLGLALHHIVSDGWSMRLVVSELGELYEHLIADHAPELSEPSLLLQYADFAVWHREWLTSAEAQEHVAYWCQQLDGVPPLRLPPDPAAPGAQESPVGSLWLGPATSAALAETARSHGASLFMVLLTAFAATLARWSGQRDFVVTVPVVGRSREELYGTVGFFVNTLPIRVDASGNPTLLELLRRIRLTWLEAYDHQDVPYETMVRSAAWQRNDDGAHLGPVMFALRVPLPTPRRLPDGVTMEVLELPPTAGEMDVFAELVESPGEGLRGQLAGQRGTFHARTMDLLAGSLARVLTVAASGGGVPLDDLPVTLRSPEPHGAAHGDPGAHAAC